MLPTESGTDTWKQQAACRDAPTSWFFYDGHVSSSRADLKVYLEWRARAYEICAGCPSREPCAAYATSHAGRVNDPGITGIWGGEDDFERSVRIRGGRRKCRSCQKLLPVTMFGPRTLSYDGYTPRCNKCQHDHVPYPTKKAQTRALKLRAAGQGTLLGVDLEKHDRRADHTHVS